MQRNLSFWIACLYPACAAVMLAAETNLSVRFPYFTGKIIPTPQSVVYHGRTALLDDAGVLLGEGIAPTDGRLRELRGRIEAYGGKLTVVKSLDVTDSLVIVLGEHALAKPLIKGQQPPDKPEGYLIEPFEQNGRTVVCLQGRDDQGLLWSVVSLNQMITEQNGAPVLFLASVQDYPETSGRAFLGGLSDDALRYAVAFKFNRLVFQYVTGFRPKKLPLRWRTPYPEDVKAAIKNAGAYLNPLGLEWYGGGRNIDHDPKLQIRSKSEEDLQFVLDQASAWLDAGANFTLHYDDVRFPLSPDDQRDFGSAREADIYFINKLYRAMRQKYPGAKLLFCPPFYWGPSSPALYTEDRDEYLRAVGGRLPKEIGIWWTGPKVKSNIVTPEMAAWITERIQRKPWYWQNSCGMPHPYYYHYYTDPVPAWREWFYPGFFNDVEACGLNGSYSYFQLPAVTLADILWNPGQYDPEASICEAAKKSYGADAWRELLELNARLSYFDQYEFKRSPRAVANIEEIKIEVGKLKAAHDAVRKKCREFDSLHVHQIEKWFYRLQRDPKLKEKASIVPAIRRQADSECQLRKDDEFIAACDFNGGKQAFYALGCERRFQLTLFGAQSAYPRATAGFQVEPFPPSGNYRLIISGQDDDAREKCRIRVSVNGHEIYSGENPFVSRGWSRHTFVLPAMTLDRSNTLLIESIEPDGQENAVPWFMINYAVLRKTSD